jgi:hypothetical protein
VQTQRWHDMQHVRRVKTTMRCTPASPTIIIHTQPLHIRLSSTNRLYCCYCTSPQTASPCRANTSSYSPTHTRVTNDSPTTDTTTTLTRTARMRVQN